MIEAYITYLLIMIGIYVILSISFNFIVGYSGLLNLGHIAFFGIGAYGSALLSLIGVPFILSLILAGLIASFFGFVLVLATRNLRGDYLALATMSFGLLFYMVFLNWNSVTGGPLGLPGIPRPSFLGISFVSSRAYLLLVAIVAGATLLLVRNIINSPFGRIIVAIRDNEAAASALGVNVLLLKIKSMMLSTFLAGIAGVLYAHFMTFIDPPSFYFSEITLIITIVMIGGLASLKGSVAATVVIMLIPEMLRFIEVPESMMGPTRQIIFALLVIAILLFRPRGLFGQVNLK